MADDVIAPGSTPDPAEDPQGTRLGRVGNPVRPALLVPRQEVYGSDDSLGAHISFWAARLGLDVLGRLPRFLREATVGGLARLAKVVDRRHTAAARRFLRAAFGDDIPPAELERRVLQSYRWFLGFVVENAHFNRIVLGSPDPLSHFQFEFSDDAKQLIESGRGMIAVTLHLGDWEAGAAGMVLRGFDNLYVVGKPPKNRPMSIALQEQREARGCHTLPRRGAMQFSSQVIEGGGVLALLLDQRTRDKPAMAPFFGRPARCDRSAGVLIRRLRAPLAVFAFLKGDEPWTYRVVSLAVFEPEDVAGLSPEEIAGKLNAVYERMILDHPDQYFWLHDRFKDTPAS